MNDEWQAWQVNGWAGWEDWREDKGVGAPDSAVARVDERSAVVEAAMVVSTSVATGGVPGLGVGVGANVTWGLLRRAGAVDDVLGPLLRRAETRLRSAPGRELPDEGGTSSSSTKGCRRFIQIVVCHWTFVGRDE